MKGFLPSWLRNWKVASTSPTGALTRVGAFRASSFAPRMSCTARPASASSFASLEVAPMSCLAFASALSSTGCFATGCAFAVTGRGAVAAKVSCLPRTAPFCVVSSFGRFSVFTNSAFELCSFPASLMLTQPELGPAPVNLWKERRSPTSSTCLTRAPWVRRLGSGGEARSSPFRTRIPPFAAPPTTSQTTAEASLLAPDSVAGATAAVSATASAATGGSAAVSAAVSATASAAASAATSATVSATVSATATAAVSATDFAAGSTAGSTAGSAAGSAASSAASSAAGSATSSAAVSVASPGCGTS
mmetsp:Transcript_29480/g.64473  ORF Transcript_29480/g.64473 Transcript_29480/m.64473 type:complete len:305 (+) Transcript_29480:879-1793(+)